MKPPEMEAPNGGSWLGEWELGRSWTSGMPSDAEGELVWVREYLEHDGHEECCHHTWPVVIPVAEGCQ